MQASCSPGSALPASAPSFSGRRSSIGLSPPRSYRGAKRVERGNVAVVNAIPIEHHFDLAQVFLDHASLAYENIVLPCSRFNCGDVVYRSTLDPALRLEQKGFDPRGLALIGAAIAYLTATPGVLQGAIDYYILAPLQRLSDNKVYTKEDIKMGRKLATGGFGTVYRGELLADEYSSRDVIVKKAKEFGEAEVWMNERLMRVAPSYIAEFITAFEESSGRLDDPLWLVWAYEGDNTLSDLMGKRDFPFNVEPAVFGRELSIPKGPRRKLITIRLVMQRLLEALKACHSTGIVHRDVKPQNVIVCGQGGGVKLIDLGAAADLRVGINYVPNEFLLDPRYAPPQQYIMSTQTPKAPPLPLAALLSPVLWRMNQPDRFDMYSLGIMFMQMVFQPLRSDNNLIAFNRKLEQFDWDLNKWRAYQERRGGKDFAEGFQIMDMDDGAPWELACKLVQYTPGKRLSAAKALQSRWFNSTYATLLKPVGTVLTSVGDVVTQSLDLDEGWLENAVSGTQKVGGLTEAQLSDELGVGEEMPKSLRNASTTIAWWQKRQSALSAKLKDRQNKVGRQLQQLQRKASKSVAKGPKQPLSFKLWGRSD